MPVSSVKPSITACGMYSDHANRFRSLSAARARPAKAAAHTRVRRMRAIFMGDKLNGFVQKSAPPDQRAESFLSRAEKRTNAIVVRMKIAESALSIGLSPTFA